MYRRGKTEIIKDILELCKIPVKKTNIVYQCNLNFMIVKKYLESCLNNGLLEEERIGRRIMYTTTDLGRDTLDTLNQTIQIIQF